MTRTARLLTISGRGWTWLTRIFFLRFSVAATAIACFPPFYHRPRHHLTGDAMTVGQKSMSFAGKNLTQGGQMTAYRWRMFFQVNNWIGFWIFILFAVLASAIFFWRICS